MANQTPPGTEAELNRSDGDVYNALPPGPGVENLRVQLDDFDEAEGNRFTEIDVARVMASHRAYERAASWFLTFAFTTLLAMDFLSYKQKMWAAFMLLTEMITAFAHDDALSVLAFSRHIPRASLDLNGVKKRGDDTDAVLINSFPRQVYLSRVGRALLCIFKIAVFGTAHSEINHDRCDDASDCNSAATVDSFVVFVELFYVQKAVHTLATNLWWIRYYWNVRAPDTSFTRNQFVKIRVFVMLLVLAVDGAEKNIVNVVGTNPDPDAEVQQLPRQLLARLPALRAPERNTGASPRPSFVDVAHFVVAGGLFALSWYALAYMQPCARGARKYFFGEDEDCNVQDTYFLLGIQIGTAAAGIVHGLALLATLLSTPACSKSLWWSLSVTLGLPISWASVHRD